MKLVKIKSTDKYQIIEDIQFDANLHIDRTNTIVYWEMNSSLADYCYIRDRITEAVAALGGFSQIKSQEDKNIILKYTKILSAEEAVPYLMTQGYSLEEAQAYYILLRSTDIRNAANCYAERLNKPEFTAAVIQHFAAVDEEDNNGQRDAEVFLDNCRNFIHDLKESAVLGTFYGNNRDGFFDYIEDTGGYLATPGLSSFFNLPEEEPIYLSLIKTIKDIIYYGYTT